MSERAAALAEEFERQVAEYRRLIESLTPEQLSLRGVNTPGPRFMDEDEGRPVNVIAYHVASFLPRHVASTRGRANGESPPPNDARAINAAEADERQDVTTAEALARMDEEAPKALEFIRGLSDEQLDRTWTIPMGEISAERAILMVLIGHLEAHRRSIEATIGA